MENTLGQSPSTIDQDEKLKLKSGVHGVSVVSSVESKAFKLNNEASPKGNLNLGESKVFENCRSSEFPEQSTENVSSTLLESAFKIMKTFFSPEKANNKKSPNSNNHLSVPESSNVHMSNKQKIISSETEVQMPAIKSSFPEENNMKDKEQLTVPVFSPRTLEVHSNDDESFITSLSYDESFQSAVTHFDENNELNKNFKIISDSALNNSQDLDLTDSCNSVFDTSACWLENTMLRNDSFSSKENHNGFPMKNTNGNTEGFNGVKNNEVPQMKFPYHDSDIEIDDFSTSKHEGSIQVSNNPSEMSDFSVGLSIVNGVSNESGFHESDVKISGLSNREKQSPQRTQSGFQQAVSFPPSTQSSSANTEYVNTLHKIKIDLNDSDVTAPVESPVSSSYSFSPLSKNDMNDVEEMLLALKKDSGSNTSLNFLDGNDAVVNKTGSVIMKNSNLTDTTQKSVKTPENAKSDTLTGLDKKHEKTSGKRLEKTNLEKPELIESQTENKPKTENLNHEKVGFDVDKELIFENSSTSIVSVLEKNVTVLHTNDKLSQTVLLNASKSLSLDETPSNSMCSEVLETETETDSVKIFLGKGLKYPTKHSTPVSDAKNNSLVYSSGQSEPLNSLDHNDRNSINIEMLNARSEPQNKVTGIVSSEDQLNVLNKNPEEKDAVSFTESFDAGNWILPPKSCNEFIDTFSEDLVLRGNPESSPLNPASEAKRKKEFEKISTSPRIEEIFCNTSSSFTSETSNLGKITEPRESVKLSQNEISERGVRKTIHDKIPHGGDSKTVDLIFDKKTDASKSESSKLLVLTPAKDSCFNESNGGKQLKDDVDRVSENGFSSVFTGDGERSEYVKLHQTSNFLPASKVLQPAKNTDDTKINEIYFKDCLSSRSFSPFHPSENPEIKNQFSELNNEGNLQGKSKGDKLNEITNQGGGELPDLGPLLSGSEQPPNYESVLPTEKEILSANIEPDVAELIEQQFTPTDIAKICDIANLQENFTNMSLKTKEDETVKKGLLSPKSFDFLSAIQGKPTGRDLSRESLYVKFDPLVQPPSANSLIDFTKEVEALAASEAPPAEHNSSICEELLAISPEKKSDAIVPPLTPLSDRSKKDKAERLRELQNEIYFLKNLYSERERINKGKIEEYETRIAKLTGDKCVLEDKLTEYGEREKSLVKKVTAQTNDIEQLKIVMKEYIKVITMLTTELETLRANNAKQIETLTAEKESYVNHLQNTEAAFSDVHTKYEKSKKTIENLKKNEVMYKSMISEHAGKMEEYKRKAKEAQEKALEEFNNIARELHVSKSSHSQEVSRLRAQLKKTELKLEAVQESLDQKVKENQQLTAICDELIEGKK